MLKLCSGKTFKSCRSFLKVHQKQIQFSFTHLSVDNHYMFTLGKNHYNKLFKRSCRRLQGMNKKRYYYWEVVLYLLIFAMLLRVEDVTRPSHFQNTRHFFFCFFALGITLEKVFLGRLPFFLLKDDEIANYNEN